MSLSYNTFTVHNRSMIKTQITQFSSYKNTHQNPNSSTLDNTIKHVKILFLSNVDSIKQLSFTTHMGCKNEFLSSNLIELMRARTSGHECSSEKPGPA
ncbi:hypothetical protein Hanom_Chr09g00842271 [Helianthus anomalus]